MSIYVYCYIIIKYQHASIHIFKSVCAFSFINKTSPVCAVTCLFVSSGLLNCESQKQQTYFFSSKWLSICLFAFGFESNCHCLGCNPSSLHFLQQVVVPVFRNIKIRWHNIITMPKTYTHRAVSMTKWHHQIIS